MTMSPTIIEDELVMIGCVSSGVDVRASMTGVFKWIHVQNVSWDVQEWRRSNDLSCLECGPGKRSTSRLCNATLTNFQPIHARTMRAQPRHGFSRTIRMNVYGPFASNFIDTVRILWKSVEDPTWPQRRNGSEEGIPIGMQSARCRSRHGRRPSGCRSHHHRRGAQMRFKIHIGRQQFVRLFVIFFLEWDFPKQMIAF